MDDDPSDDPTSGPARRGRSVRAQLGLYALALVGPMLVFVGIVLWTYAQGERARLEEDASDTARAVVIALDRDAAGLFASLDVLSTSAYLRTGDIRSFYDQAGDLARRQGLIPVLAEASGQQLVNLRVPFGTPLPISRLPKPAAPIPVGTPYVTDLFSGLVAGTPVYAVAQEVPRSSGPPYTLNFSLELGRLDRILRDTDVPPGYVVSIVDRAGVIMARNVRSADFVGKVGTADLRQAMATGSRGSWTGTTADGQPVFGTFMRSGATGFTAAVGVRHSDLNAPLWRSLSLFAALGGVAAALSALLGLLFGQRITAPLRALAGRAALLGRGEPVPALDTGLREADQVGGALSAASVSLRSREADLREANDEIQRFAYIVSHDLRSPLVNIMGFTTELEALRDDLFRRLEGLRQAGADPGERLADRRMAEDFDEAVGFIKTSIGKMDRLIHAILALSREGRRPFQPERIDMDALAAGIRANLKHQADAIGATVDAAPLPAVTSDRLALEQIFGNLVDNAIKYLRAGVPGRIEITGRRIADGLTYTVKDNGRGIDGKDLERVFELFRRSGVQDRPGEGIGLAHVRALVRRLGGTISLTSEPGQGSTFTVTLPARWSGETRGIS